MSKQGQSAENKQAKDNKPAKVEQPVATPIEEMIGYASSLSGATFGAAGEGGAEEQANLLRGRQWQSAQQQALVSRMGRAQGNGHVQRVMASLVKPTPAPAAVQREDAPAGGHKMAMAIPFTWQGGDKEMSAPVGSLVARKLTWSFEGSVAIGEQPEKAGDKGMSMGPAGGASKDGAHAGFKIEDVQRLCSEEFTIGGVPGLATLDTKESFQLTSDAIDISVALEGNASVSFKSLNLQTGAAMTGQLTLLKKEFAKLKDGDKAASKPTKFVNASFGIAAPIVAWQPRPDVQIQGKLQGAYEIEPNWTEILRRITEKLGEAATSAAIETAIATGFVVGGILTIGAAVANIIEGDWINSYCSQASQQMVQYLQDYDSYMRGEASGGSPGFVDAAAHIKKVYEVGHAEGSSTAQIDEVLKSKPKGYYAAEIWNKTKADILVKAEQDYWEEHSITKTLHDWGLGDDESDHDFKVFKRALNAHIDGKMQPLFGFSASWVNG